MVESDLRPVEPDRRVARLRAPLGPLLAIGLAALAYRGLVSTVLHGPAFRFENWLFRPSQLPPLLVLGVAGWLVWRRRERLAALPERRQRELTALFAFATAALFLWALLTRSTDLLMLSLVAATLAFGSAARGSAGVRVLRLPALVLALGVAIPLPLRNEIVWSLQRATAVGSQWLLALFGSEITREGIVLRSAEHSFQVIDGCSGLQGMATLALIAILVGELLALSASRRTLLVALALALGHALNVLRIAYIASRPNPEAYVGVEGDHTTQGLVLLAVGTALLYGLGRLLAGGGAPPRVLPRAPHPMPWRFAAAGLGLLTLLSLTVAPFAPRDSVALEVRFPEERSIWKSAPIRGDPFFYGVLIPAQHIQRRYQRGADPKSIDTIDLFVAVKSDDDQSGLFSSKLQWPGPDWTVQERRHARLWDIATDAKFSVAERASGAERAVVYTWRRNDGGLWRESWRSLLALEASPFRRERERAVVQLVAYSPWGDDPVALDRARVRLDRFIAIFGDELMSL